MLLQMLVALQKQCQFSRKYPVETSSAVAVALWRHLLRQRCAPMRRSAKRFATSQSAASLRSNLYRPVGFSGLKRRTHALTLRMKSWHSRHFRTVLKDLRNERQYLLLFIRQHQQSGFADRIIHYFGHNSAVKRNFFNGIVKTFQQHSRLHTGEQL